MDIIEGTFLFVMETNIEIWRDVPGYENMYQCSSFGRVVSIKTGFNQRKYIKVKILNNGYSSVQLKKGNILRGIAIHKIVAMTFLGYDTNDRSKKIKHKDGNLTNNNVNNLFIPEMKSKIKGNGVLYDTKTELFVAIITIAGKTVYREEFTSERLAYKNYQFNLIRISEYLIKQWETPELLKEMI